jgi:hypothetical protein
MQSAFVIRGMFGMAARHARRDKPKPPTWRLEVKDADAPAGVEAFLRQLVDVLLDVGRQPDAEQATNENKRGDSRES